jgi:hypothetical protein
LLFCNKFTFDNGELLPPCPVPKLQSKEAQKQAINYKEEAAAVIR